MKLEIYAAFRDRLAAKLEGLRALHEQLTKATTAHPPLTTEGNLRRLRIIRGDLEGTMRALQAVIDRIDADARGRQH